MLCCFTKYAPLRKKSKKRSPSRKKRKKPKEHSTKASVRCTKFCRGTNEGKGTGRLLEVIRKGGRKSFHNHIADSREEKKKKKNKKMRGQSKRDTQQKPARGKDITPFAWQRYYSTHETCGRLRTNTKSS